MGLLDIFKRSTPSQSLKDPKTGWLAQLMQHTATPVPVTSKSSLGLASYWRCVNLISQSIASMPIKYYDGNSKTQGKTNRAIESLRDPSPNITPFTYNEMLIGSALIYGNGYAYIDRLPSKIELIPLHSKNVEPFIYDDEIYYDVKSIDQVVPKENIIHLRGFGLDLEKGLSAMDAHRQTLGLALASQREALNFYAKGTKIDGYLKMAGKLDQAAKDNLKNNWAGNYGINGTGSGTAVLDGGMEYERLGMPPADAKFIESNSYSDTQIATIFGVPAPMINQLERATHSNIEQLSIDFVRYCLMPWIRKLEQEYYRKLLTSREKGGYFKFNVSSLMRGDSKTRAEFYRIMVNAGIMTRGEARSYEDLDPMDGDNVLYVPLNMIPIDKADGYHQALIDGKTNNSKEVNEQ